MHEFLAPILDHENRVYRHKHQKHLSVEVTRVDHLLDPLSVTLHSMIKLIVGQNRPPLIKVKRVKSSQDEKKNFKIINPNSTTGSFPI